MSTIPLPPDVYRQPDRHTKKWDSDRDSGHYDIDHSASDISEFGTEDEDEHYDTMTKPSTIAAISQPLHADTIDDDPVIIAVMGVTGCGKSTFISNASNEKVEIGHQLESCTQEISTYKYVQGIKTVHLIDTPGFDDTNRTDTETLESLAEYLEKMYRANTRLAGIIYLHRIKDERMQGAALRNLRMFRKLCGEDPLKNVILATTFWGEVSEEKGKIREQELIRKDDWWGGMKKRGSTVTRLMNDTESAQKLVGSFFNAQLITLRIQAEMVQENKFLVDTDAGGYLNQQLAELQKKHKEQLEKIQKDLEEAIKNKDTELRGILENERTSMTKKLENVEAEQERLKESGRKAQEELLKSLEDRLRDKAEQEKRQMEWEEKNRKALEGQAQVYGAQIKELRERELRQQAVVEDARKLVEDIRQERAEEKLAREKEAWEKEKEALMNQIKRQEEERMREEAERKRQEEERKRQEEDERKRQEEERKRQEEEKKRQEEDERKRQEEERKKPGFLGRLFGGR